jgi:hypothetical protein
MALLVLPIRRGTAAWAHARVSHDAVGRCKKVEDLVEGGTGKTVGLDMQHCGSAGLA